MKILYDKYMGGGKQKLLHSAIIIITFLIASYGNRMLKQIINLSFDSDLSKILYTYAWWVIPILIAMWILYGFTNIFKELCLSKGFYIGLLFGIVTVSPMLISSAVMGTVDKPINWLMLTRSTLFAGFFEELLFRGFLFGILFRKLGWGFIPASVLGAVIFAIGHLYQAHNTGEVIGIFMITFIGSAWFAWIFIEWKENLWIPIFLHILMNFSWTFFNVSENALGGLNQNIFRFITIAITVLATIYYNLRIDRFRINGKNLFLNRETL